MRAIRSARDQNALYGIRSEDIAAWCGVHITTARRWKRYGDLPVTAAIVIALRSRGELELIDPAWAGWRLRGGVIVSPDGAEYTPGEVLSTTYWRALARHYQVAQRLPQQADWVNREWVQPVEHHSSG